MDVVFEYTIVWQRSAEAAIGASLTSETDSLKAQLNDALDEALKVLCVHTRELCGGYQCTIEVCKQDCHAGNGICTLVVHKCGLCLNDL